MVKKFLLGMMAFATLFATSCTNELDPVEMGNTSTVSFKVGTPAIESRAYSDGATATVLQYAVYDANGNYLSDLTETDGEIKGSTTVKLQLTTGNTYSVIFWAAAEDAPYAVNFAAKTMTVDYDGAVSNDESRDAFYKYHTFTVNGAQTETIELRRPFAQLNIGTADYEYSEYAGYVPTQSSVTVKNIYSTLNLATGEVDGSTEVPFGLAAIPEKYNEQEKTGEKFPVAGYEYLAMNYLLVAADKGIVDIEFTYADANNDAKTRTVGSVPVQRNYRTNIYGNLLTSQVDVNVEIKPEYKEPDNNVQVGVKIGDVCYESFAKAYEAAQDGDVLVVVGNFVLSEQFVIEKNITIDLNGNEITTVYNEQTKKHLYAFTNKASLVIKNGTIKSRGIYNYGTLTLEEGAVIDACDGNGGYGIYNFGTFIMNGGEVKASNEDDNMVNNGGYDATPIRNEKDGKVTINGGVINNLNDYTFAIDNQAGGEVTVNGGVISSIHSTLSTYGTMTINGGEFTCNGLEGITAHVLVAWNGSTTTINGGTFDGKDNYNGFNVDAAAGATVNIKGGEFKSVHSGSLYGEGTIKVSGGVFFDKIAAERIANGYELKENQDGTWTVDGPGYYVDANGNYHILNAKGWLWMADQVDDFFGSKTIYLDEDIDFAGVDMRVTRMWKNEYSATFDGQNHTIKNVWMASNYNSNNQALFDGLMSVKNLKVEDTHVYGYSQVGIIGANIYGTIENCHVKNSRSYGYVHHVGGIVGLHSWGEIKNCSVENTKIECYYYGAVGAIAGAMNEVSRNVTGCVVKDCKLIKEGPEGVYPDWDPLFGIVVGYIYANGEYNFSCDIENSTIKGVESTQLYGGKAAGATVKVNGCTPVTTAEELKAAITAGGKYILFNDIAMTEATYQNVDFTLDGNGYTISQAEGSTNNYALFDSMTGKANFKNVKFAGIKGGAVIRTIGAELTMDNVTVKNCEHTQIYGLFRLIGKNIIKNSKFENNKCTTVITFNTEGDGNTDPQLVQNCEFTNNTCSATAVVHYSTGGSATIDANKFLNNTLTVSNGATLYMGFKKNCTVTNNVFDGNTVTATSTRSSGGLMIGNAAVVTGNCFVNNTVTVNGQTGYGNDVCASPYYAAIDLSGNYWGGGAPVEGDDYYKEYNNYEVIINDYLTTWGN